MLTTHDRGDVEGLWGRVLVVGPAAATADLRDVSETEHLACGGGGLRRLYAARRSPPP